MTWPNSRLTTYAAGSQVKSADLDAIQDFIVARSPLWRTKFPTPITAVNWATNATFNGWVAPGLQSSGAGSAFVDLDIPQGYKLGTLILACLGNAAANLTIEVDKAPNGNTGNVSLGALVLNALSATEGDQTLNMLATSTGLSVTVTTGGAGIYTRSAGSYITDGFFVGQLVTWTGFVNGGNNVVGAAITVLTATVMTLALTTQVNETGPAAAETVAGVSPTVDSTFSLQLRLIASAAALQVKSLRYSCAPQ